MNDNRHTGKERMAVIERSRTSDTPIEEIAAKEGVSTKTIRNWLRSSAPNRSEPAFIELPVKSSTLVELTFADGTTLRVRG